MNTITNPHSKKHAYDAEELEQGSIDWETRREVEKQIVDKRCQETNRRSKHQKRENVNYLSQINAKEGKAWVWIRQLSDRCQDGGKGTENGGSC